MIKRTLPGRNSNVRTVFGWGLGPCRVGWDGAGVGSPAIGEREREFDSVILAHYIALHPVYKTPALCPYV
jgi:hypothetical protein